MPTVRMGFPQWALFEGFLFQTSYTDLTESNSHLPFFELRKETDSISGVLGASRSVKGRAGRGRGEGLGAGLPPPSTGGCTESFCKGDSEPWSRASLWGPW